MGVLLGLFCSKNELVWENFKWKDNSWRRVCIHEHSWSHSTQLQKSKCPCILEEVNLTIKEHDVICSSISLLSSWFSIYFSWINLSACYCITAVVNAVSFSVQYTCIFSVSGEVGHLSVCPGPRLYLLRPRDWQWLGMSLCVLIRIREQLWRGCLLPGIKQKYCQCPNTCSFHQTCEFRTLWEFSIECRKWELLCRLADITVSSLCSANSFFFF